jgi:hypothetical protein
MLPVSILRVKLPLLDPGKGYGKGFFKLHGFHRLNFPSISLQKFLKTMMPVIKIKDLISQTVKKIFIS